MFVGLSCGEYWRGQRCIQSMFLQCSIAPIALLASRQVDSHFKAAIFALRLGRMRLKQ